MTTITKEEVKAFIEQIESDLANGWEAQIFELKLARIALASLEAEPIGAFHIADQQVGGTSDYIKDGEWPIDNGVIEVYAAPPAPAVIQSSQLLHDFYRAYADWLISGGDGQFSCVNGLCANLFDYCDRKGVGSAQALNEMHVQFVTAGMNEKLPFNTSVTDFDAESADGKCHLNTARRKWVFRRIIDGVKPVPVVPEDISGIIERFRYQADHLSDWHHIDEHSCKVNRRDLMTALEFMDSCRASILNGGKS